MLEEKTPKSGGAIKKIDVSVWERREIFAMYAGAAFPYFAVTASVDAAKLHAFAKENQLSFYFALVYILVESADSIPEFHYRLKDREPVYVSYGLKDHVPVFSRKTQYDMDTDPEAIVPASFYCLFKDAGVIAPVDASSRTVMAGLQTQL